MRSSDWSSDVCAADLLDLEEVGRRAAEAADRGATEVCLQGGIHPDYDGNTYLNVLRTVRTAAPSIHIHAFSPLEVTHGASTLGLSLHDFLTIDRKSTRLNSSHSCASRMPASA